VIDVYIDDLLKRWIVDLVRATRSLDEVAVGASVRGSLALERAARAWALLDNRPFVVPEDVDRLFGPVLLHRIVFRPAFLAEARRLGWSEGLQRVVETCFERAPRPAPSDLEPVPLPPDH
jgi:MoxR-like ATPase